MTQTAITYPFWASSRERRSLTHLITRSRGPNTGTQQVTACQRYIQGWDWYVIDNPDLSRPTVCAPCKRMARRLLPSAEKDRS